LNDNNTNLSMLFYKIKTKFNRDFGKNIGEVRQLNEQKFLLLLKFLS